MRVLSRGGGGNHPRRRETPSGEFRKKSTFLFGAEEVSTRYAEYNLALSGGTSSGKTTAMIALMVSRIDGLIASGRPFNIHAYTCKPDDFYPLLRALYEPLGISVRFTCPFMKDSYSWDGSLNLTDPPKIDELVATLIKQGDGEKDSYWKKASQLVVRGLVQSLATSHPGLWTMRHVVACTKDLTLMRQVLGRCEYTRHVLTLLSDDQGVAAANLHGTLLGELKGLELIAAAIDDTPDHMRFSLTDAANQPYVIYVWATDPRYSTTVDPWNALQWELMGHELLIRGKTGVETCLFIDEFPQLNGGQKLPVVKKLLETGRSNGVRITIAMQSPTQVVETWGKEGADTILSQCHGVMIFRHADMYGQEYWSQRFGRMTGFEKEHSYGVQTGWSRTSGSSRGHGWSGSLTENVAIKRYDRERVTRSNIGDIPVGTYDLGMFGYASLPLSLRLDPRTGFPEPIKWPFAMTPEWIARNVPKIEGFTPYNRSLKPESSYTMRALESSDYDLLDLQEPPRAAKKPAQAARPKLPKKKFTR